jgi:hypothetical protein
MIIASYIYQPVLDEKIITNNPKTETAEHQSESE